MNGRRARLRARRSRIGRSVALAALLLLAATSAARAEVVSGREGAWPLADLGRSGSAIELDSAAPSARVGYVLAPGARQGPRLWYLLRLHAVLRLGPGDGRYVLSAANGLHTAAQIIVTVRKGRARVDLLGLVRGHEVRHVRGRTVPIRFENYSQIQAIKPGRSELSFRLEHEGGSPRTTATILPSSGIVVTSILPDELLLDVEPKAIAVHPADEVRVRFDLHRRGGRADVPLRVTLSGAGKRRLGESPRVQAYEGVGSGREGVFVLHAPNATGRYLLGVSVPDRYNQPTSAVQVKVVAPAGRRLNRPVLAGAVGIVAAFGVGALIRTRRRHA